MYIIFAHDWDIDIHEIEPNPGETETELMDRIAKEQLRKGIAYKCVAFLTDDKRLLKYTITERTVKDTHIETLIN